MCGRLCGCLFGCFKRIFFTTIVVSLFIAFCPNLPPQGTFVSYQNLLKPYIKLEPNTALNAAERILDGELTGPEAFTAHKGVLYAGLHGGHIVKVLPNKVESLVKTGKACAGIHEEHLCGRPLGLRVKNGVMYIADAYYGIFQHVISDKPGKPELVVRPNIIVNGKPAKIFNSVEVDADNNLYFTSSSTEFDLTEGLQALLASGTGRLLKFDAKTREVSELLGNLHFSNGLALSGDGESLLISETNARRILKYNIKSGKVNVLLDGLPGSPDNIQYAGDNTYWVSLVVASSAELPSLSDVFADWPNIRRFLARSLNAVEFPFVLINQYYPNRFCEMAAYHIGHLAPIMALLPDTVQIIRFDGNTGKVIDSLQGNNGAVKIISDVAVVGDYLYLGSPANNYVGRLALSGALKGKYPQTEEAAKQVYSLESPTARKAAAEKAKKEEEAKKAAAAAAEAKKVAAAEAAKKAAAEEAAKKAEEAKKAAAAEAKKATAAEEAKKAAAAEAAKKAEEAKKAAAEKVRKEEEAKNAAAAAEAKKSAAAEEAKKAAAAEATKKAEEARKAAAEKARKEEETKRVAAEKARKEEEAKKVAAEAEKVRKEADKAKTAKDGNKRKPEPDPKENKVADEANKPKVHGDKAKTEL